VILAHLPLTLVCLDGLGKLSEKHPMMATTAVACLRDFLINPSDILTQLYSSSQKNQGFNKPGIKGKNAGDTCISEPCTRNENADRLKLEC
jgi:phosphatidylinositol 4-kinase